MGVLLMKKHWDLIQALILIAFLVIAILIGNMILRGILLLLFSTILIINTVIALKSKSDDKFSLKFFYGILLFLEFVLAFSSLFVIISSIIK
jgi:hypothetical protein